MAIIYSYPTITNLETTDLFIISRLPEDPEEISNYSVTLNSISTYIIDKAFNGTDNYIPKFDGTNSLVNSLFYETDTGRVGLGTTTPSRKLQVAGDVIIDTDLEVDGGLDVAGTVRLGFTGNDPVILGNPTGKRTEWNNPGYFEIYAENPDSPGDFNETVDIDGDFQGGGYVGVYPVRTENRHGVRMHSRDGSGIEANFIDIASVESSAVYDENQIRLITAVDSLGAYAGIKVSHPTDNRFRFNSEFSTEPTVPFLVNSSSKFTGQVTIPLTPIANTDAASKGYVDSQLDKDLQIEGDTGTGSINLDTQVFDVAGGTYIDTAAGGQTITVDISAVDGNAGINERYLTKNNTWAEVATIPGTYTFDVSADTGTAQTVNTTETLLLAGGTYINTSVGAGPEVTFNHDNTTLTTTSSTISPVVGGSFSVIDSITTNLQGHVTEINTLTVILPDDGVDGSGTANFLPRWIDSDTLGDSGFYQSPSSSVNTAGAIILNTTFADTSYGEVPGLRVASRVSNTPGVIDLFRNDSSVTTGESVGILQYSVLDDGRYTVAQIGVETLTTSGSGDSGGGKFIFKTTEGGSVGPGTNTPESRFTLDYNSADFLVPVNVTSTAQSSFAGQVTIPITPVAATDAASKAYVDSQSDNYVDGGSYSNSTGTLSLTRTGGLADVDVSGFLEEAPSDGSQYARQNGGWSVVSGGGGGVTGDGNQYNIPVWNGTTELSGITSNTVANKLLSGITTTYITAVTGSDVPTQHVIKNYDNQGNSTGTLTYNQSGVLRFSGGDGGRIDVGLNAANIANSDLNVGTGVATFKGGVIISNSPGSVQVDNSSLVIGSGTNDNISGSDHCLIVGSGNQITSNSDQSVAFGQGNAITGSIDAFAVGNSNTLTSSLRTQAIGFNNTVQASSSFVAGGANSITATSNIFALGDSHTVTGTTQDAYLLGTSNTITGGTGSFAIGSNLDGDTGNHMVIGYRNDKTSYPTTNYSLGLGNTKFALAVGSTTTTNSNALLITEGGVNRGGGVAQVPRVLLPTIGGFSATDDTAAGAIGIPLGGLYQSNGSLRINTGSIIINQGSWTPTITAIGGSNFSFNPIATGANVGYYVIEGDIVNAWFVIPGTANWTGTSGFPLISGLPYSFDNTISSISVLSADISKTSGLSAQVTGVSSGPSNTSLGINVLVNNNSTNMALNGTGIVNGTFFSLSGCIRYKLL